MAETVWDACGLRRTPCRAAVLRCLSEQSTALSEKELTAKLAGEFDVILTHEDRFSNVAHKILEAIWKSGLVDYSVSENRVKNVIYGSIDEYLKSYEKIEDSVYEMMQNYKRKLIPGTDEYDLIFERLYQDELKKRGML